MIEIATFRIRTRRIHAPKGVDSFLVDENYMINWADIADPTATAAQRQAVYRLIGNRRHLHRLAQQATAT